MGLFSISCVTGEHGWWEDLFLSQCHITNTPSSIMQVEISPIMGTLALAHASGNSGHLQLGSRSVLSAI